MNAQDTLRRVANALEQASIPYMFTGSFASSYHGTPRASQDIDIVIAPTPDQLQRLHEILSGEYYFDLNDALDAYKRRKQFNVIDLGSGWKVDFIIRKARLFSLTEFDRRIRTEIEGIPVFIASAEDVILAKLEWAKLGSTERQTEDAAGILRIRRNDLDWDYLEQWIEDLNIREQWTRALELAGQSSV